MATPVPSKQWQLPSQESVPDWLQRKVGERAAALLWQRGIREPDAVAGFCHVEHYQPTPAWAFAEMEVAVERVLVACDRQEQVTIWGDFDADGVTATAVLWEGLRQFLDSDHLEFYIPNRFTESHGVSVVGIERLHSAGTTLVITCDTGSTSLEAIARAAELGIDVIVTDHHTLPAERPDVVAMLNPRQFESEHPLATLSGVAVAFKFVEALYERRSQVPTQPLETLLDLVAIGLVADLVELRGDVRYLAQRGIEQLKKRRRTGVTLLLEACKRAGDRAMDIAFGLGPRINAVSRIHGDARFCVELLVERDRDRAKVLAEQTELANTRRKGMQAQVEQQARSQAEQLDLSTDVAMLLASTDWPPGVLGIVAGQLARDYNRPVFLFRIDGGVAAGSARSVRGLDLYSLLAEQQDLITSFGGHPLAAGLRLPAENLPLLRMRLNQSLRNQFPSGFPSPELKVDLAVPVAELGQTLFRELSQLEPYGMGNRIPRLLVQRVQFENVRYRNRKDSRGNKIRYPYTTFTLRDHTGSIAGIWWGHASYELPKDLADVVVELDYMSARRDRPKATFDYQVRLIDVRAHKDVALADADQLQPIAIDLRGRSADTIRQYATQHPDAMLLERCPQTWSDITNSWAVGQSLALAYGSPIQRTGKSAWEQLVGWTKSLLLAEEMAEVDRWCRALEISEGTLELGFRALRAVGFQIQWQGDCFRITTYESPSQANSDEAFELVQGFQRAVSEEDFQRRYFYDVEVEAINATLQRTPPEASSIQASAST